MNELNVSRSFWNEKWAKIKFDEIENAPHYEAEEDEKSKEC